MNTILLKDFPSLYISMMVINRLKHWSKMSHVYSVELRCGESEGQNISFNHVCSLSRHVDVIWEETTPVRTEIFHYRIKVIKRTVY